MLVKTAKVLTKIVFAIIFGAMFWWFLEFIQPDIINYKFSCCERCGNILYDREQPVLAVCAGLSFLISAFLKTRSRKVIWITIAAAFCCFFPYWLFTFWTGHPRQECSALNYPRGSFPLFNELRMFVITGIWASVCAAALLVVQGIKSILYVKEACREEL